MKVKKYFTRGNELWIKTDTGSEIKVPYPKSKDVENICLKMNKVLLGKREGDACYLPAVGT